MRLTVQSHRDYALFEEIAQMSLVIWHRDGLTVWSGSIQADLPAVIRPVSFCLKRKPALLRLVILVRHTCWQTGLKAVCHWIQIKLYDMKDFCGRAPVLQYSYTANTYFKKSKSRFHANNRNFFIAVITTERQEKEEVKLKTFTLLQWVY